MQNLRPADVEATPAVCQAIDRFLTEVRHHCGDRVERVVLYGSVARGEATDDSDVDLVVLWDGAFREGFLPITEVATRVFVDTGVLISPKVLPVETWDEHARMADALYQSITDEGVVLA